MNYGYVTRSKPRIQPRRGFNPGNTQAQTRTLPILPFYVVGGTSPIISGEAISIATVNDKQYWVKGRGAAAVAAGVSGLTTVSDAAPVFFAYQDAADYSVRASGKLLGLDSNGSYTLATAFYTGDDATFVTGAALTITTSAVGEGTVVVFNPVDDVAGAVGGDATKPVVGYVNTGVHNIWEQTDEAPKASSEVIEFNTTFITPRVDANSGS